MQLVGTNYQQHLLKYVERDNLPEYLGGTSKSTLLDDVGPWQQQNLIDEINADYRAAVSGAQPKEIEADSSQGTTLKTPKATLHILIFNQHDGLARCC